MPSPGRAATRGAIANDSGAGYGGRTARGRRGRRGGVIDRGNLGAGGRNAAGPGASLVLTAPPGRVRAPGVRPMPPARLAPALLLLALAPGCKWLGGDKGGSAGERKPPPDPLLGMRRIDPQTGVLGGGDGLASGENDPLVVQPAGRPRTRRDDPPPAPPDQHRPLRPRPVPQLARHDQRRDGQRRAVRLRPHHRARPRRRPHLRLADRSHAATEHRGRDRRHPGAGGRRLGR